MFQSFGGPTVADVQPRAEMENHSANQNHSAATWTQLFKDFAGGPSVSDLYGPELPPAHVMAASALSSPTVADVELTPSSNMATVAPLDLVANEQAAPKDEGVIFGAVKAMVGAGGVSYADVVDINNEAAASQK